MCDLGRRLDDQQLASVGQDGTGSTRRCGSRRCDHDFECKPSHEQRLEDCHRLLQLWYVRLSSLSRLRLFNQTSAECTNLFTVLNAIEPPEARAWLFDNVLPFELEVIHARLKYWAGDHMGYLDALYALLHKCKTKARQAGRQATALAASRASAGVVSKPAEGTDASAMTTVMWKERGARICLIMASQLMEMNVSLCSMLTRKF